MASAADGYSTFVEDQSSLKDYRNRDYQITSGPLFSVACFVFDQIYSGCVLIIY